MKKSGLTIVFVVLLSNIFCQNLTIYDKSGKWGLGANIGTVWQSSDVYRDFGTGMGLTFERRFPVNDQHAVSFSLRSRYLHGISYGLDFQPNSGILNNPILNGDHTPSLNYFLMDSFVYDNHKTRIDDLSLEAIFTANRLMLRSHFLFYGWAGFGFTGFKTWIDQLDQNGDMYDYAFSITANPLDTLAVLNQLRNLLDGKYESLADGITKTKWVPAPNFGIGLGYKFSNRVSLGLEYKLTLPFTDLLDGEQWNNQSQKSGGIDVYHYTVLGLKFLFGSSSKDKEPVKKDEPVVIKGDPPVVIISQPVDNPHNCPDCRVSLIASILNIQTASQIRVTENDMVLSPALFSWDGTSKLLKLNREINSNTKYSVTATNAYGSSSKSVEFLCTILDRKPKINIERPGSNPYITTDCTTDILIRLVNVTDPSKILITENGIKLTSAQFIFNPNDLTVSIKRKITGQTIYAITAQNEYGIATKELTINCQSASSLKPEITITKPTTTVYYAPDCMAQITAVIKNVTVKGDIKVSENGAIIPGTSYTFIPSTGAFSLTKAISSQSTFVISAFNSNGSALATQTINCKSTALIKPTIVMIFPSAETYQSVDCRPTIRAQIFDIESISQVEVYENNVKLTQNYYTFTTSDHILTIQKEIKTRSVFVIKAINNSGSASSQVVITCAANTKMPVVTITKPSSNPFTTSDCNADVAATVLNIIEKGQITVSFNGVNLTPDQFNYEPYNSVVSFRKAFQKTAVVKISASNNAGTVSASVTINCNPVAPVPKSPVITITKPATTPFTPVNCISEVVATFQNIDNASQITVTANGNLLPSAKYVVNMVSKTIAFTETITKSTTYKITGTTAAGTASDEVTINCVPVLKMPSVTITSPSVNPLNSSTCLEEIKAVTTNIDNISQISVTANGLTVGRDLLTFNAATGLISFKQPVVNTVAIKITVTNATGSASAQVTVNCVQPLVKMPFVTIVQPTSNPYNSVSCNEEIRASIKNIESASQISVSANNVTISPDKYIYNPTTKILSLRQSFSGSVSIKITATNSSGTTNGQVTLNCSPPVNPPVIIITKPGSNPFNSLTCTADIKATISNVLQAAQVSVTANGFPVSQTEYSFDVSTGLLNINQSISKAVSYVITATNSGGSVNKEITINCTPPPSVSITSPKENPFTTEDCFANIYASTNNIDSKNQITITANSQNLRPDEYEFNSSSGIIFIKRDNPVSTIYRITVNNQGGSASDEVTINCKPTPKPPVITLTNPTSRTAFSQNCKANVTAKILNIDNASGISVYENEKLLSTDVWNFNATTGILTFQRDFMQSAVYTIKAVNKDGTASVTINYTCPTTGVPPFVEIISPSTSPYNVTNCYIEIIATVKYVSGIASIKVYQDNNEMEPNFWTWDAGTGELRIRQDVASKSDFTITATNANGSASKSVTITCYKY